MNTKMKEVFDKVHAEDELKNHTKEFLAEKMNDGGKRRWFSCKRFIAAIACFAVIIFAWGGYSAYFTPAFAISLDVNPSIELGINRFDMVVSVETFNEDGNEVMSSLDVNYMGYKEALKQILADKSMERYLTKDQVITITVFGADEDKNNEMLANVTACAGRYANVHFSSCNSEEVAAAHDAGLSFGKYKAFLELKALDPDVAVEDVQGLTMRQIRDRIEALSGETDDRNGGSGRGNGCGFGGGRGGNGCRNGK